MLLMLALVISNIVPIFTSFSYQAYEKGAEEFSANQKLMKMVGYTLDQISNIEETDIYYKCIPWKTYISKEEKPAPRFKTENNHLTVMLSANVNGGLWDHTHLHLMVQLSILFQIGLLY